MAKVYYWLKLDKDFFKGKEIKKLRKIAGGDTYTIIYLKLQLLSLKDEGKLYFDAIEDTFAEELALELDEESDNITFVLMYLKKCGLVQAIADDEILLNTVPYSIGKETDKAELMRKKRSKEKELNSNIVTELLPIVTNCYTEKRREEKDIELEREKDICIPYLGIIDYLNLKANTKYKSSGKKTKDLIKARFNEKYTLEDFKIVIDKKCNEWLGTSFENYLRPETLFSNKFEGYLNQKEVKNVRGCNQQNTGEKQKYNFGCFE